MLASTNCTNPKYMCAGEKIKLIGALDGWFPDFGHHLEKEMGGLWLGEIKLLDGFWLRFQDQSNDQVNVWITADRFENHPYGNRFTYRTNLGHTQIEISRRQIASDRFGAIAVEYQFHNQSDRANTVSLEFLVRTDLRPVWLSELAGVFGGDADIGEWDSATNIFCAKDCANEWHVALYSEQKPNHVIIGQQFGPEITHGNGISCSLFFDLTLDARETKTVRFFFAGSSIEKLDCLNQLAGIRQEDYLQSKLERAERIARQSALRVEDPVFETVFEWIKYNTDSLTLDAGRFGRGLAAGAPEYLWWFGCDNSYALQGVLAMGDIALCRDTLSLILRYSEQVNGNGRIIHEITPAGVCANPGNTQETAHFIVMAWKYYQWSADKDFLLRALPYLKKSIAWLQEQDSDGDFFPSGYGIIEISGLNAELIDSAAYTCEALYAFSDILTLCESETAAKPYLDYARQSQNALNTLFWDEKEGLYCDVFASPDFVRARLNDFYQRISKEKLPIVKARFEQLLLEKADHGNRESGWLINKNWVIAVPMENGMATESQAHRALNNMLNREFIGPYGVYLSAMFPESTMTISTGVLAVALARYGYADEALDLLKRMFSSFGMATPGSISEMSPDYGCFVQAWTAYAAFVPIVTGFFGVLPMAAQNKIQIKPQMPSAWRQAELTCVKMLDGELSIAWSTKSGQAGYDVKNETSADLSLYVAKGCEVEINGVKHAGKDEFIDIFEKYVNVRYLT